MQSASPARYGAATNGSLPAELTGTFAVTINPDEVAQADEAGDWFLSLTGDDGYQFGRLVVGTAENYGDLTVDGDHLTFSNEKGVGACSGAGTYIWRASGDSLTLTLVADGCAVRVVQNSAHPYRRCPEGIGSCRDVLDRN